MNESFSFYQAIQIRGYYSKANKEEKPELMVKKLRFYARYIVICLLLRKVKQVKDLIKEFSRQIDDYVKIYDPSDQIEWQMVKNEINDFMEADSILNIENTSGGNNQNLITLTSRLNTDYVPKMTSNSQMLLTSNNDLMKNLSSSIQLNLQEILIVGNCQDQVGLLCIRVLEMVENL